VECVVRLEDAPRALQPAVEIWHFRVVQEAVDNGVRHGSPQKVEISPGVMDGHLELEVKDNGCGFEQSWSEMQLLERGRLGLVGMNERARACGAELIIESKPGRRHLVRLTGSLARIEQAD